MLLCVCSVIDHKVILSSVVVFIHTRSDSEIAKRVNHSIKISILGRIVVIELLYL